jgi:spore coat protein U-like protein
MSISQTLFKTMVLLALLISAASLILPAYATSTTTNMNVTATISATCTMSNTDLDFGDYDATGTNSSRDLLATATISTSCTSGTNGVISMSGGSHVLFCQSSKCHRQMANQDETSFLRYNIYTNESLSWGSVWSDNTSATNEVVQVIGSGVSQNTTVYGEITKNQRNAAAGSYTDTITITLNY